MSLVLLRNYVINTILFSEFITNNNYKLLFVLRLTIYNIPII